MTDTAALVHAVDRLLDAFEDNPESETTQAIAAEVESAGITANCCTGLTQETYHTDPDIAARYILGQLINCCGRLPNDTDALRRLVIYHGMVNAGRRFRNELLGDWPKAVPA